MLEGGGCQTRECQAGRCHTGCYTQGDVRLRDARLGDYMGCYTEWMSDKGMPGWAIPYGYLYRRGCQTKGYQAGRFHTGCYTEGDVRLRDARLGDFIREFIQKGMSD